MKNKKDNKKLTEEELNARSDRNHAIAALLFVAFSSAVMAVGLLTDKNPGPVRKPAGFESIPVMR